MAKSIRSKRQRKMRAKKRTKNEPKILESLQRLSDKQKLEQIEQNMEVDSSINETKEDIESSEMEVDTKKKTTKEVRFSVASRAKRKLLKKLEKKIKRKKIKEKKKL
ncbi:hypothetical protein SNEBB_009054 [Seison nebaliae]|nr:hypothetical protein SNEBB_009054 [Seison nebaliae]